MNYCSTITTPLNLFPKIFFSLPPEAISSVAWTLNMAHCDDREVAEVRGGKADGDVVRQKLRDALNSATPPPHDPRDPADRESEDEADDRNDNLRDDDGGVEDGSEKEFDVDVEDDDENESGSDDEYSIVCSLTKDGGKQLTVKVKLSGGTEVEGEDIAAVQQVMARAFKHDEASQTSRQAHELRLQKSRQAHELRLQESRQAHELCLQESRQSHELFKQVLQYGGKNAKLAEMVLKSHMQNSNDRIMLRQGINPKTGRPFDTTGKNDTGNERRAQPSAAQPSPLHQKAKPSAAAPRPRPSPEWATLDLSESNISSARFESLLQQHTAQKQAARSRYTGRLLASQQIADHSIGYHVGYNLYETQERLKAEEEEELEEADTTFSSALKLLGAVSNKEPQDPDEDVDAPGGREATVGDKAAVDDQTSTAPNIAPSNIPVGRRAGPSGVNKAKVEVNDEAKGTVEGAKTKPSAPKSETKRRRPSTNQRIAPTTPTTHLVSTETTADAVGLRRSQRKPKRKLNDEFTW